MTTRRAQQEEGSASAELVIATPLLLLMLLLIVQFALFEHATHVAQAAAQQALDAARVQPATATSGDTEARDVLSQLGAGLLVDPTVSVTRTRDVTRVEVHSSVEAVIPFLHLPVSAVATGTSERFRPTTDQP